MNNQKNLILKELDNPWIPDIYYMFKDENLECVLDILNELLNEEKVKFEKLLKIPKDKICFEIFDNEDKVAFFYNLLDHFNNVNSNEKVREIIEQFRPNYIDFVNYVSYNKDYYEMFVYCRDNTILDSDQKRIIDVTIRNFELSWINLSLDKQDELKVINQELAKLGFDFNNNVLDSEKEFSYIFEDIESIKDMPQDSLEVAKNKAKEDWIEWYKFTSDTDSYMSVMKYCDNSEVRKIFYNARNNYASSGKFDNHDIILKILELRQKEAQILGYNNYAEYSLVDKMADSPKEVLDLFGKIWEKAVLKWKKDIEELRVYFGLDKLELWDSGYYSRIMKEKKYDVDEKIVKQYFELENVLGWLFDIAKKLFWVEFEPIDIPESFASYDIRGYKAFKNWEFKSYFFLDLFYRKEKTSWAWATHLRDKFIQKNKKIIPIVVNVCSFQKWANGKTLLTLWNVNTMFHEFWHALHSIFDELKYNNSLDVEKDFVEVPSQLMENWCYEKDSIKTFAKHHETWEVILDDLLDKLEKLKNFMSWFAYSTQIEFGNMDMILYSNNPPLNSDELDKKVLESVNKFAVITKWLEFKIHNSFSHIFAWSYAAGYYSYLRSEIIETDIFGEFKKNGIFDKETWEKYYKTILSQWSRKPAKELFRDFMWRDVSLDAFFEKNGL